MRRYVAYTRVSTAKQGEHGSSLQEQRAAIEAFAARHSLSIHEWFEERETAAKLGRAIFTKLLKRLEKGDADGIIIHKIDRSARNLRDWAALGELIDRGIDVQFAHDPLDLRSRGGRLSADIQAVVAADYIRNLREEVRKGFYGRLKQGLYPLPAPIGYLDRGKGKPKDIDPVYGPLVKQAFDLYATGTMGLNALRTEMGKRGLVSHRSKKPLSLCGLSTMLHNPFYMGLIYVRTTNETFEGVHTPLVSKAIYDRVQAILSGKTVLRTARYEFLFRKLARCGACGYFLLGERQKGHVYYRCHACKGVCVREEVIEEAVGDALKLLTFDSDEREALKIIAEEMQGHAASEAGKAKNALAMRVTHLDERLVRLTDAFIDQHIDKETFEARKVLLLSDKRSLADQLQAAENADPTQPLIKNLELASVAYISYGSAIPSEKRRLVESLSSNLSVHGKKPMIELCSPFREVSNWRKTSDGAPARIRTRNDSFEGCSDNPFHHGCLPI